MKFCRIDNLLNMFGEADYKGFNIDLFKAGSQVYDSTYKTCIIATTETHSATDVTELTEEEYLSTKKVLLSTYPESAETTMEKLQKENEILNKKIETMSSALDELIFGGGM